MSGTSTLSLLTPLWAPTAQHLDETWKSVAAQELPDGWQLEWCLQEDGSDPRLADWARNLDRAQATHTQIEVHYGANGHGFGPAVTRNHALSTSTGSLVVTVDQDDLLCPGALAALVGAFDDPSIHWAAGRSWNLHLDGSLVERAADAAPGTVAPGETWQLWERTGTMPVYPTATAYRADALWEVGGWPGLGRGEDNVLLLTVSELHPGVVLDARTHVRRRWDAQATGMAWMAGLRDASYGYRYRRRDALGRG